MDLQEILWRIPYQSLNSLSCVSRNFYRSINLLRGNLSFWRSPYKADRPARLLPTPRSYEIYYVLSSGCKNTKPGIFSYEDSITATSAYYNTSNPPNVSDRFFLADCKAGIIETRLSEYLHINIATVSGPAVILGRNKVAAEWYTSHSRSNILAAYTRMIRTLNTDGVSADEAADASVWFFKTWPKYDTQTNRSVSIEAFSNAHAIFSDEFVTFYYRSIVDMAPMLRAKFYGNYMPLLTRMDMLTGLNSYRIRIRQDLYTVLDSITEWMLVHKDMNVEGLEAISIILDRLVSKGDSPYGDEVRIVQNSLCATYSPDGTEPDPWSKRAALTQRITSLVEQLTSQHYPTCAMMPY